MVCVMQHVTATHVAGMVVTVHSILMTPGTNAALPCSAGGTSMMASVTCNVTVMAVFMMALTATSLRANASESHTIPSLLCEKYKHMKLYNLIEKSRLFIDC